MHVAPDNQHLSVLSQCGKRASPAANDGGSEQSTHTGLPEETALVVIDRTEDGPPLKRNVGAEVSALRAYDHVNLLP